MSVLECRVGLGELGCSEVCGFHGLAAASQCGVAKAGAKCQSGMKDSDTGPLSRGKVSHASLFGWKYITCPAVMFGGGGMMGWMRLLFRRFFSLLTLF